MEDLPDYALQDLRAAGFDTLSIVVRIICENRGCLATKFATECIEGNHEP